MASPEPTSSDPPAPTEQPAASRSADPAASRRGWMALLLVALLLRLGAMVALGTPEAAAGLTPWKWGGESACLADSVLDGRGYGDPWAHDTGPSGWLTPPYPLVIALCLAVGGGVGPAAATCLYVLQALASALTCVVLLRLGCALGRERAGWWAAWFLALYPPAIWNAVKTVWDTTFVALAVTLLLERLVAVHRRARERGETLGPRAHLSFGLGYGALCFLNPAGMALAPAVAVYLAVGQRTVAAALRAVAVFVVGAAAVATPWMLRNARVVDSFSLRPNLGVEMMIGNNGESRGRPLPFRFHPSHVPEELALYRELGEGDYCRDAGRRARRWIGDHPGEFARLVLLRAQYFWLGELPSSDIRTSGGVGAGGDPASWIKFAAFFVVGVAALVGLFRARLPWRERLLFLLVAFGFSGPYLLTHVSERYRFPIDPLLILLGVAWALARFGRVERSREVA